jgi:hypothetical protein
MASEPACAVAMVRSGWTPRPDVGPQVGPSLWEPFGPGGPF